MKRLLFFISVLLICSSGISAKANVGLLVVQPDTLPVPKEVKNMMFYLQRDPNINTVVYELNKTAQGAINDKEPIHVYWIRYAEGGEHKELSYIQRKFAYGLNSKKLGKDNYELKFVCYSKLAFYLRKGADEKYHMYTTINGKEAILDRVFVRIEGGTFWVPNVLYVDLKGRETATGKAITGRIKP